MFCLSQSPLAQSWEERIAIKGPASGTATLRQHEVIEFSVLLP
jgi:hypothetical protein